MFLSPYTHVMSVYLYTFVYAELLQSCLTLCDPRDCSQAPLSVEILQARLPE